MRRTVFLQARQGKGFLAQVRDVIFFLKTKIERGVGIDFETVGGSSGRDKGSVYTKKNFR